MEKTIELPDGTSVTAEALRVESSTGEHWTELTLEDGAVVRFKAVASEALRRNDLQDQEGNPVYHLKIHNVVSLHRAPDK